MYRTIVSKTVSNFYVFYSLNQALIGKLCQDCYHISGKKTGINWVKYRGSIQKWLYLQKT